MQLSIIWSELTGLRINHGSTPPPILSYINNDILQLLARLWKDSKKEESSTVK
jgi:hypothetical protein